MSVYMDAFLGIFYRLLKRKKGERVPLEYESCSPEHHFTFEAILKKTFLSFSATSQCSVHLLAVLVKLCT